MHWIKKAVLGAGALLVLPMIAGFTYHQIGADEDASLKPPASEMISVNGHNIHFFCMGNGPHTYLLEAAHASWSFAWWRIQPLLAKTGRACAFDRPGYGWSDWNNRGYDGVSAATQLAAIVKAAHLPTPFIYVGHSLGANFALIYADKYPKDVSALVLLDPADPESLLKHFHGTRADAMTTGDCGVGCNLYVASAHLGVTRLMTRGAGTHTLPPGPRAQSRRLGTAWHRLCRGGADGEFPEDGLRDRRCPQYRQDAAPDDPFINSGRPRRSVPRCLSQAHAVVVHP